MPAIAIEDLVHEAFIPNVDNSELVNEALYNAQQLATPDDPCAVILSRRIDVDESVKFPTFGHDLLLYANFLAPVTDPLNPPGFRMLTSEGDWNWDTIRNRPIILADRTKRCGVVFLDLKGAKRDGKGGSPDMFMDPATGNMRYTKDDIHTVKKRAALEGNGGILVLSSEDFTVVLTTAHNVYGDALGMSSTFTGPKAVPSRRVTVSYFNFDSIGRTGFLCNGVRNFHADHVTSRRLNSSFLHMETGANRYLDQEDLRVVGVQLDETGGDLIHFHGDNVVRGIHVEDVQTPVAKKSLIGGTIIDTSLPAPPTAIQPGQGGRSIVDVELIDYRWDDVAPEMFTPWRVDGLHLEGWKGQIDAHVTLLDVNARASCVDITQKNMQVTRV